MNHKTFFVTMTLLFSTVPAISMEDDNSDQTSYNDHIDQDQEHIPESIKERDTKQKDLSNQRPTDYEPTLHFLDQQGIKNGTEPQKQTDSIINQQSNSRSDLDEQKTTHSFESDLDAALNFDQKKQAPKKRIQLDVFEKHAIKLFIKSFMKLFKLTGFKTGKSYRQIKSIEIKKFQKKAKTFNKYEKAYMLDTWMKEIEPNLREVKYESNKKAALKEIQNHLSFMQTILPKTDRITVQKIDNSRKIKLTISSKIDDFNKNQDTNQAAKQIYESL